MKFEDVENARKKYVEKRKATLKKINRIAIPISVGVCAGSPILSFVANSEMIPVFFGEFNIFVLISVVMSIFPLFFFVGIIDLIVYAIILSVSTKEELAGYKKLYKAYFVAESFRKVFSDISYNHESELSPDVVKKVMTTGDRYSSNDLMTAKYKNIGFTQADVHTEREHEDDDGHTYYSTIFRGRFLVFDFDRNFASNLQVESKGFFGSVLPKSDGDSRKFEKLKTESNEFNNCFTIRAQDGIDALYILDPAFMEKIQNLYNSCGCELLLTFMDKKLYIALNNHSDSFEIPSPSRPLDEKTELEKVQKDILVITNFVDALKLDKYFRGGEK